MAETTHIKVEVRVAFEFLTLRMAHLYCSSQDSNGVDKFQTFNSSNDFSKSKLDLLPFIISIGNGQKEKLLDFFDAFFEPTEDGIIHLAIHDYIFYSKLSESKEYFEFKGDQLVLNNQIKDLFNANDLGEIKRTLLSPLSSEREKYQKVNDIMDSIDKSIKNIVSVKIPYFSRISKFELSDWCRSNLVYDSFYKIWAKINDDNRSNFLQAFISALKQYRFELTPFETA